MPSWGCLLHTRSPTQNLPCPFPLPLLRLFQSNLVSGRFVIALRLVVRNKPPAVLTFVISSEDFWIESIFFLFQVCWRADIFQKSAGGCEGVLLMQVDNEFARRTFKKLSLSLGARRRVMLWSGRIWGLSFTLSILERVSNYNRDRARRKLLRGRPKCVRVLVKWEARTLEVNVCTKLPIWTIFFLKIGEWKA